MEYAWNNKVILDGKIEFTSSKYAEMIAEAWAEYCNNPQPRALAKENGELLDDKYQKLVERGHINDKR